MRSSFVPAIIAVFSFYAQDPDVCTSLFCFSVFDDHLSRTCFLGSTSCIEWACGLSNFLKRSLDLSPPLPIYPSAFLWYTYAQLFVLSCSRLEGGIQSPIFLIISMWFAFLRPSASSTAPTDNNKIPFWLITPSWRHCILLLLWCCSAITRFSAVNWTCSLLPQHTNWRCFSPHISADALSFYLFELDPVVCY